MSEQQLSVWQYENLALINGDFLKTKLPDKSIDCVITSPPYNTNQPYGPNYNDNLDYADYLHLMRRWLKETFRITKDNGRVFWNVPLDTSVGGVQRPVFAHVAWLAERVRFQYRPLIIWEENHASKGCKAGSDLTANAPYGIAPSEIIFIFYKDSWRKFDTKKVSSKVLKAKSDITRDEQSEWMWLNWKINGETRGRKRGNPAPWPAEISYRCIKRYTFRDELILDPFVGSGTTLSVCQLLGRSGVGIEINSIDPAIRNITSDRNLDPEGWQYSRLRRQPDTEGFRLNNGLMLPSHSAA